MTGTVYRSGVKVEGGLRQPQNARERLPFTLGLLRAFGDAEVTRIADAIESFAANGGDLPAMLGLKLPSGGARQRPEALKVKAQRDRRMRELARSLDAGPRKLAALLRDGDPRVSVFLEECPDAPSSVAQVARILREVDSVSHQAPTI